MRPGSAPGEAAHQRAFHSGFSCCRTPCAASPPRCRRPAARRGPRRSPARAGRRPARRRAQRVAVRSSDSACAATVRRISSSPPSSAPACPSANQGRSDHPRGPRGRAAGPTAAVQRRRQVGGHARDHGRLLRDPGHRSRPRAVPAVLQTRERDGCKSSLHAASRNRRSPSSRACASHSARCSATASTRRTCGRSATTTWPACRAASRSEPRASHACARDIVPRRSSTLTPPPRRCAASQ